MFVRQNLKSESMGNLYLDAAVKKKKTKLKTEVQSINHSLLFEVAEYFLWE